ncbi:Serine/threonine protein phosphatase 2A 59 kDa regulatory subunit B' gamma isoform [Apostasia shenzhenica]|uniref:Serine/threonine protein phosphatase 2A 59 kDa regulatory subunit B' gamma isoform n=1 Tax=Apostasia shenzhenica TaxID=1088818 RepID=A0A2I0AZZ2_9ASPA|nr:Serine/threonine protein phosphatase 2A 59 kDa regulatory subunit B' gamma isoform [Apostasia shenzhenica]
MIQKILDGFSVKPSYKPAASPAALYKKRVRNFHSVPSSERQELFLRKLDMCCVVFDFSDPAKNKREKEIKRRTLLELVAYIPTASRTFHWVEVREAMRMVAANIFRTFSSSTDGRTTRASLGVDVEEEEEEPKLEPSWPHLQIVYEFLLRFVTSINTEVSFALQYIDSFILHLLDLFNSEDPRERQSLRAVAYQVYWKFVVRRGFMRKAIKNLLYEFMYETQKHNGIAEILELLGSIISGFEVPLRKEHNLLFIRVLVPLHKPQCLIQYHQSLSYCIIQFVKKDNKMAGVVIRGLLKYWPRTNSLKEALFLKF